jgi:hypothetical protein
MYLDTGPLPDGYAIADVQSPEQRSAQVRDAEEHGDGWLWPVPNRATLHCVSSATGRLASAAGPSSAQGAAGASPALRALLADRDPGAAAFTDPDWELHDIPTGHWAMFSALALTAAKLAEIAG